MPSEAPCRAVDGGSGWQSQQQGSGYPAHRPHSNQTLLRDNRFSYVGHRIYKYFDEVNATPVVHHWKYKMDEIDPGKKVSVGLAI